MNPLISVSELRALVEPPVVLDVRYRMGGPGGIEEYAAGHLPGAAYVDLETALAARPGAGGRHPLPASEVFNEAMRQAGVGLEGPVVVYDDWAGHAASRAWWLLRHHGHSDVQVLDGGWAAWVAAGGEIETGTPVIERGDFHGAPGAMRVVDAEGAAASDVLVDARSPERFRGETEPVDPVAGRIPGAVNVPTSRNLDNHGHFRDRSELARIYEAVGAGVEVAVYCGSGITACHDILALEVAGVPAALYPGSWSDWITDPSRPVEAG